MTKHTDSSRSTDSGVSGNARTGAREIRCGSCGEGIFHNGFNYQHVDGGVFCRDKEGRNRMAEPLRNRKAQDELLADLRIDGHTQDSVVYKRVELLLSECSRLASRVEELEAALDDVLSLAKAYLEGKSEKWMNELGYPYQDAVDKAEKLLAGAHAEGEGIDEQIL